MKLSELYDIILPEFPPYAQKDLKTAVRNLAQALNYADPKSCPLEACKQAVTRLDTPDGECRIRFAPTFEAHLITQGKRKHTIRNVKNNLSRLFRLADARGILPLTGTTAPMKRQYGSRLLHLRPGCEYSRTTGTYLTYRDWPTPLKHAFTTFAHWATAPLSDGREARWQKRQRTIDEYRKLCEAYFGYLYHQRQIDRPTFDQLFDFPLVNDYVHWHVNERHKRVTTTIKHFLKSLLTLSRQYRPLPKFQTQLKALDRRLPQPPLRQDKADAWVSTTELMAIGKDLWPSKPLHAIDKDGSLHARNVGLSIVFRLWTFIPYRARNVCEMTLEKNLYKDSTDRWRIRFAGEQLKVAIKQGRPNIYDLPFPEILVPALEDYLANWRPVLTAKGSQKTAHVFLTMMGHPFPIPTLYRATTEIVHGYTNKHWHPHIVRTVWATEWIRDKNPGDFYGAAIMLNDTLQTVIDRYSHLLGDGIAEKVYERLSQHQTKAAFSAEAKRLLAALAEKLEISQSAVLELLNRSS